jgi:hypothetical protein
MARKSALKVDFWCIPTLEIGEEKPTAFRMRQMVKRDFDRYRHKNQLGAMIPLLLDAIGENQLEDQLQEAYARKQGDEGFDEDIYRECISEVKNIYVDGDFKESITDPDEIVTAIAGLEDVEVSDELDNILWRRSTLEPFETVNFTPSSGCNSVCRTKPDDPTNESSTVENAKPGRIGLRPSSTEAEDGTVSSTPNRNSVES